MIRTRPLQDSEKHTGCRNSALLSLRTLIHRVTYLERGLNAPLLPEWRGRDQSSISQRRQAQKLETGTKPTAKNANKFHEKIRKETGVDKKISFHLILQLQESKFVSINDCLVFFRIKVLKSLSPASLKNKISSQNLRHI